jgi:sugar lactone lactonase YvrE
VALALALVVVPCLVRALRTTAHLAWAATGRLVVEQSHPGFVSLVVAGSSHGLSSLVYPAGVAVDKRGDVLIADNTGASAATLRCAVDLVVHGTRRVRPLLGSRADINGCKGIALLSSGAVAVSDTGFGRIVKVSLHGGRITTLAGRGETGPLGDGGPARLASFFGPTGIAVGPGGELIIADTYHNRVRRVGRDGVITTVAGTGVQGFSGDGGSAKKAELNDPLGVAVDRGGNIFIADEGNRRVREVLARSGRIFTVAGGGRCRRSYCGNGGQATRAGMDAPQAVVVDGRGNIYIGFAGWILEVPAGTGVIRSIAGNGRVPFTVREVHRQLLTLPAGKAEVAPVGMALDSDGSLLWADTGTRTIRELRLR